MHSAVSLNLALVIGRNMTKLNLNCAGLLHVEISTEVCSCLNIRFTFQWISQQAKVIVPLFNSKSFFGVKESLCTFRTYEYSKNIVYKF